MIGSITIGHGANLDVDLSIADRFWLRVNKDGPLSPLVDGPCWLWTGTDNGKPGYGIFRGHKEKDKNHSRKWVLAHRYSYMLNVGPIPQGMEIDHICRNRLCVNPTHLRPLTHRDNTLAGTSPSAEQARRVMCIRGHPFDKIQKDGKRRCSICDRAKELRRYERKHGRTPKPNSRTTSRIGAAT